MSNPIKKLTDLNLAESFLQVDFIKGFKYIDRAGEIVNTFHQGNMSPVFEMSLQGLIINDPDVHTKSIKVSSNIFWAHFLSPASLDLINSQFEEKLKVVFGILEIKNIRRIGWRNYFIKEFRSEIDREKITKKFSPSEDIIFQGGMFYSELEGIEVNIRLNKAQKDDSTPALLFDIDCFQKDEEGIDVGDLPSRLSTMKNVLRSEALLKILNQLAV